MNQEAINLTKIAIKYYEEEKLKLTGEILSCRIRIEQAEKDVYRADNIKHSLDAALEKLEEADEKEGRERDLVEEEIKEVVIERDPGAEEVEPGEKEEPRPGKTIMCESKIITPGEAILAEEEKDKAILEKADRLIADGKKAMEEKKKGWELCPKCCKHRMAPWNKKGMCSPCQLERKTKANL